MSYLEGPVKRTIGARKTMRIKRSKPVLTTGEVARICRVTPRTVSKWFDSGRLGGYRIPGSRDRRIPVDELVAFMRRYDIPLDALDEGVCRILIVDAEAGEELAEEINAQGQYEIRTAGTSFQAGALAQEFHPHVIVVAAQHGIGEAVEICRDIQSHRSLQNAKVIAAVDDLAGRRREELLGSGFNNCLAKPYTAGDLIRAVEETMNLVT